MTLAVGDVTGVIAAISAVGGSVVYIVRSLRRFLVQFITHELDRQLAPIKAQLAPNGGESLRDRVDQLGEWLDEVRTYVNPSTPNPPPVEHPTFGSRAKARPPVARKRPTP